MSLENVIAENTQAINNLAELIRQAMHMMPPTAPAAYNIESLQLD